MKQPTTFSVARDFSQYPAGRFKSDGPAAGEALRTKLVALLRQGPVNVELDGVAGYPGSFVDAAFGGLAHAKHAISFTSASDDEKQMKVIWAAALRDPDKDEVMP